MTDPLLPGRELHTWKEIAAYLGISIREAQEREKRDGMPVRRLTGKKARVSAYADELDSWKRRATAPAEIPLQHPSPESTPAATSPKGGHLDRRKLIIGVGAGVTALAVGVGLITRRQRTLPFRTSITGNVLFALDNAGRELWRQSFSEPLRDRSGDAGRLGVPEQQAQVVDLFGDGNKQVLFVASFLQEAGQPPRDEIFCYSGDGGLLWRCSPELRVRLGDSIFSGPWNIRDLIVLPDTHGKSIWLALAHWNWRPGAVLRVNPGRQAELKFVNAGHIYALGSGVENGQRYIVAGGVNNEYACAALAIFNESGMPARSPQTPGTRFECTDGPRGGVDRYFLFPPTEITLAADKPYNELTSIEKLDREFVISTREIPGEDVRAIYRFSETMEPRDITFDNTWAARHRRLQEQGKLTHRLQDCPNLHRPAEIRRWDSLSGWKTVRVPVNTNIGPEGYKA